MQLLQEDMQACIKMPHTHINRVAANASLPIIMLHITSSILIINRILLFYSLICGAFPQLIHTVWSIRCHFFQTACTLLKSIKEYRARKQIYDFISNAWHYKWLLWLVLWKLLLSPVIMKAGLQRCFSCFRCPFRISALFGMARGPCLQKACLVWSPLSLYVTISSEHLHLPL